MDNNYIFYIIGFIFLISVLYCIFSLFTNSTIGKGISKILGVVGNLLGGLTNGCSKQDDCSKKDSQDDCINSSGCEWKLSSDQKTNYCAKTDPSKKVSKGGIFSPSCALGFGFLLYIIGQLTLPFITAIAGFFSNNKNAKLVEELSGKSTNEVIKELYDEAYTNAEKSIKKLRDKGIEVDAKMEEHIGSVSASKTTYNKVLELTKDTASNEYKIKAYKTVQEELKTLENEARENDISEEDIKDIDEITGKIEDDI